MCHKNYAFEAACPAHLWFNTDTKECQSPDKVNCRRKLTVPLFVDFLWRKKTCYLLARGVLQLMGANLVNCLAFKARYLLVTSMRAKGPHIILSLMSISRWVWGMVGAFLFLCDMQYERLLYKEKRRILSSRALGLLRYVSQIQRSWIFELSKLYQISFVSADYSVGPPVVFPLWQCPFLELFALICSRLSFSFSFSKPSFILNGHLIFALYSTKFQEIRFLVRFLICLYRSPFDVFLLHREW